MKKWLIEYYDGDSGHSSIEKLNATNIVEANKEAQQHAEKSELRIRSIKEI